MKRSLIDQQHVAVAALQRGDIRGLEALVQLHQTRALRTAYALVGNRQTAEDIVADAFLMVYDRIGQFDNRCPFDPWFYRIVVNESLKALRSTRRMTYGGDDMLVQHVSPTLGPEAEVERQEVQHLVLEIMRSLPPALRVVLVLRYYLDMDERTIAKILGCPLGTVKWRIHQAKKQARKRLACADDSIYLRYLTGETS